MDLIDALAATPTTNSIVKLSLSNLFGRTYSSLTDVLSSLFRTNLKTLPTDEERKEQTLKVTQLLAEEYASSALQKDFAIVQENKGRYFYGGPQTRLYIVKDWAAMEMAELAERSEERAELR